jgi:ethanolamine utilization protein EutA (predicted chaperonin)
LSPAVVPSGSWNYNADDELSDETYDQDGNVTAADGKTFSYDSQNELVSMNGGAVQMVYDGDGSPPFSMGHGKRRAATKLARRPGLRGRHFEVPGDRVEADGIAFTGSR